MVTVAAFLALGLAAALLSARLLPESSRLERACATAVLVAALAVGLVYLLSAFSAIAPLPWLAATLAVALAALGLGGAGAWAILWSDAVAVRAALRGLTSEPVALVAAAVGALAVFLAVLCAGLLDPWAWDSLGYHLPIVHDALQTGTLRAVPTSVIYVNCYPRLVDVFFLALRLGLADDTWIELGQLPLALGGVVAIAAIAENAGVPAPRAVALAALWLAVPVAMLELATAYVDVAVGALVLLSLALATGTPRPATFLVAGIGIGLLLGAKPSTPVVAAAAMATVLVRAVRAREPAAGALACALALGIGGWKYAENLVAWGNPIWPAHAQLGPIVLPGKAPIEEIISSGLAEPYASAGWLGRLVGSWTAFPSRWVYDMRIGGFGPLFTLGLLPLGIAVPIAALRSPTLRERARDVAVPVGVVILASLATPGAYWARYTLAVPGALLALGLAVTGALPRRARLGAEALAVALALAGVVSSASGFTPDGPGLLAVMRMGPEERGRAQPLDAQERQWQEARALVGPGEAFGYDWSFGLPGRLWRSDGTGRVAFFPVTRPRFDELDAWLRRERVRVVVLGWGPTGASDLAREHPERFRLLFRSAYAEWQPCDVFAVIDPD